jgi:hypothetical protein
MKTPMRIAFVLSSPVEVDPEDDCDSPWLPVDVVFGVALVTPTRPVVAATAVGAGKLAARREESDDARADASAGPVRMVVCPCAFVCVSLAAV